MEVIFKKKFCVSTEQSKMEDFCMFAQNVHKMAKCTDSENCEIDKFLKDVMVNVFNEEFSYDARQKFFVEHSLKNHTDFNAIFNLHAKGKENVERIEDLISRSMIDLERLKENFTELTRLITEWNLIQRKINVLLKDYFCHDCFFQVILTVFVIFLMDFIINFIIKMCEKELEVFLSLEKVDNFLKVLSFFHTERCQLDDYSQCFFTVDLRYLYAEHTAQKKENVEELKKYCRMEKFQFLCAQLFVYRLAQIEKRGSN